MFQQDQGRQYSFNGAIQIGALTLIIPFSLSIIRYNENETAHFMAILALGHIFLISSNVISNYAKDRRYFLIGCAILGFVKTFMIP